MAPAAEQPRIGLVLGAGGIVGQAFHAGALAAIEQDLGWDPRAAEVVVGTSAGSVTGAALRIGVPAPDLAAYATDSPLSDEGAAILDQVTNDEPDFPPLSGGDLLRSWRAPSRTVLARALRQPWRIRPAVAAMTMAPPGRIDITERAAVLRPFGEDGWPEGLWICAARRDTGRRVVFGRQGSPPARLDQAVAASCAIPAYFAPVDIGGVEYFDGGVHSPTNADVLVRSGLDLVVVISSMSAVRGRSRTPDGALRWAAHARLRREVGRLRAAGTTVVHIEPNAACIAAMGVNAMAPDRAEQVVPEAKRSTSRVLAHPRTATRLAPLTNRQPAA